MSALEEITAHGNRGHADVWEGASNNKLRCMDGFTVSVIAGQGTYCHPRPTFCFHRSHPTQGDPCLGEVECTFPGPYTAVEVGYPSVRPELWSQWQEYADEPDEDGVVGIFMFVPVDLVRALIAAHGGEA